MRTRVQRDRDRNATGDTPTQNTAEAGQVHRRRTAAARSQSMRSSLASSPAAAALVSIQRRKRADETLPCGCRRGLA